MDRKRKGKIFIPKEVNRFDSVEFVNGPKMNTFRLKMCIKQIWENLQDLANALQLRRTDVTNTLDKIMDGNTWSEKELDDRLLYGKYKEFIIQFDTLEKTFTIMNGDYEPIAESFNAVSLKEAKAIAKEIRKTLKGK